MDYTILGQLAIWQSSDSGLLHHGNSTEPHYLKRNGSYRRARWQVNNELVSQSTLNSGCSIAAVGFQPT